MANIGTDILERLVGSIGNLASSVVKSTLHSLYPNEFELYMVSLELTNSRDETLDYFTFPVNPSSISKTEPYIKDIDRAYNSIIVNKTGMFAPQDITIKGNFGKEFKMLVRDSEVSFKALLKKSSQLFSVNELSPVLKNGYGCFKVLQNICKLSDEMEGGRPRRLYFHNFMLGESYLVEVLDFVGDMNMSTNMIWSYSLRMKVLTPIYLGKRRKSLVISGGVQKLVSSTLTAAKDVLVTNI